MIQTAKIPDIMLSTKRWVCWRWEVRDGQRTKVPYQCYAGFGLQKAQSNRHETWASFDDVFKTFILDSTIDGIGFMLGDGWIGFDFDDVIVDGACHLKAKDWIQRLDGYAERSPGGKGIKVLRYAELPEGYLTQTPTGRNLKGVPEKGMAVEIYRCGRFFTVTGNRMIDQNSPISNVSVDVVCSEILEVSGKLKPKSVQSFSPVSTTLSLSDSRVIELIEKSRQSDKFQRLMDGLIGEYQSHSEADFALTTMLMFWTGNDKAQTERIFSKSGLAQREKWNREDYRERTLKNSEQTKVFKPRLHRNLGRNINGRLS